MPSEAYIHTQLCQMLKCTQNRVSLVDWFLLKAVDHLQRFLESGDWLWFWMELVIGLQHRLPDVIVHGFRSGELGAIGPLRWNPDSSPGANPAQCAVCAVCAGAPSCWKVNPVGQQLIAVLDEFRKMTNVMRGVNFSFLFSFCHQNKRQQKPPRAEQILRAGVQKSTGGHR